jgi:hypothetical protein
MQVMSGPSIHIVHLRVRFKTMPIVNHKQRESKSNAIPVTGRGSL